MASDRSNNCEIQVTANGYLVMPPHDMNNGRVSMISQDFYVFETFEALTSWLDKTLKKPPPREKTYCLACDEYYVQGTATGSKHEACKIRDGKDAS